MQKRMLQILFGVVVITLHLTLYALPGFCLGPGTTGVPFLKIAPGARAVGMGEAFVATADDATALYWNPAGIIQMKGNQITYMHNFWFQGVTYSYLGYVQGFKSTEDEKFGVSIIMVNGGEIQRTLEDASGNYTGTGGNFTSYDLALALSYAWKLGEKYNFGISFKFIRSNIDDVTGYAVAADFGFLFSPIDRLNIGVNAQNAIIPVPIKYYREYTAVSAAHTLPMNIKVGAAYKLSDNVNLSLDVNFPIDNNPNFHFGAEYWYGNLAFRAGYKTDFIAGIDLLSGLTAGLGFKWKNYEADYAFVPYGDLGFTHRISLSVKF